MIDLQNKTADFFNKSLRETDDIINQAIKGELRRQQDGIELIASENYVSQAVLDAQGSILTNKYAEGYARNRYYGGCEYIDEIELIAIDRIKQLFGCNFANVQPHSGSQANMAVFLALLNPGDTILGMSLASGGHLTHGSAPSISGKWFDAVQYGVRAEDGLLDYDEIETLALECMPRLIIAGGSAYPRQIDFARFREIADKVGAYLLADVAHYAGLIISDIYNHPFPYADVVTSTTHKTLRGPRGGIILTNDETLSRKLNSAIFPGIQGGPLMHVIAAKAVAFGEALRPEYKEYCHNMLENSRILAATLQERGIKTVTGGTDSHIVLVDLTDTGVTGKDAEAALERAGLTCNKNTVPFDKRSPFITSGIRLGTPAGTTRGLGQEEFKIIADMIAKVIFSLRDKKDNFVVGNSVRAKVLDLCKKFPIYS